MTAPSSTRHQPKRIEELIEIQVRRWELERKERATEPAAEPPPPCIAVSRELGAGGLAVARRVAERLGFQLWDREIVHSIAERSGVRESLLASLDEQSRRGVRAFVESLVGQDRARLEYARQLGEVIRTIAEHGSAVIVGRGASTMVEPSQALRVRLVMARPARIAAYAAREGITEQAATAIVDQTEDNRASFSREHFGTTSDTAELYDVIINRDHLDEEAAAAIVVAAYRAKFGSPEK